MKNTLIITWSIFLIISCKSLFTEELIKDNAGLLKKNETEEINTLLLNYKKETGKQILIYTIYNTSPIQTPQTYTQGLMRNIDFGKEGFNNTFLMIIYYNQKSIVLRWGTKFNKNMCDSIGNVIINNAKTSFAQQNFRKGIIFAIKEIRNL